MKCVKSTFVACAMSALLLLNSVVPIFAESLETKKESDYDTHWAKDVISIALKDGMVKGYDDGTFRPDNSITRVEFFTIVNNTFGIVGESDLVPNDMSKSAWYVGAVNAGLSFGYIELDESGGIDPLRAITREEVADIISKVKGFYAKSADNNFTDKEKMANDYLLAINAVSEKGLMTGAPSGAFLPEKNITRAEAVVTLKRTLDFKDLMTVVYDEGKTYGSEGYQRVIPANVVVKSSGTTLKNMVIEGDLFIDETVGDGVVSLENVLIKGATIVKGGGENSVKLDDVSVQTIYVNQPGKVVRLVAGKDTTIQHVIAKTPLIIKEEKLVGKGFETLIVDHDRPLEGQVDVKLENTQLAEMDIKGEATKIELDATSLVDALIVEKKANASEIKGRGKVAHADIHADSIKFDKKPEEIKVDETVKAPVIKKEVVTNNTLSSSSSGGSSSKKKKRKSSNSGSGSTTPVTPTEPEKPVEPIVFNGATVTNIIDAEDDIFPNQLSPGDTVEFEVLMSDGSEVEGDVEIRVFAENPHYHMSDEASIPFTTSHSIVVPDRIVIEDVEETSTTPTVYSYEDYAVNQLDLVIGVKVDNKEYFQVVGRMVQDIEAFATDREHFGDFDQYRYNSNFIDQYDVGDEINMDQTVFNISAYEYHDDGDRRRVYRRSMNVSDEMIRVEGFDSSTVNTGAVHFYYDGPLNGFSRYMTSDSYRVYEKPAFSSLKMISPAEKTVYYQLDELDFTGLSVVGINGDGDEVPVEITEDKVSGYEPLVIGDQTLTIKVGDHTLSYDIEVKDLFIEDINFLPVESDYIHIGGSIKVSILLSDGTNTDDDDNGFMADDRLWLRAYYRDRESMEESMVFPPLVAYKWPVMKSLGSFVALGNDLVIEVSTKDMDVVEVFVIGPLEEKRDVDVLALAVEEFDASLDLVTETTENIVLPVSIDGFGFSDRLSVEWISSNTDVIKNDGVVSRPINGAGDANITLTATLTVGDLSNTIIREIKVLEEEESVNAITSLGVTIDNNLVAGLSTVDSAAEVGGLSAVGGDGNITYRLVSGSNDWGNRYFTITDNKLYVGSSALESNDYSLRIEAEDESSQTLVENIKVRVGDTFEVEKSVGLKVVKNFDDLIPSNRRIVSYTIDDSALESSIYYVSTNNFEGTPVPSQIQHTLESGDRNKLITIPITVTYDTGQEISTTIKITVADNAAPEVVPNVNFFEDVKVGETFTFDMSTMFTEPDGEDMTYGIYNPELFTIGSLSFNGSQLEFEPSSDAVGEGASIYLYADDGQVKSPSVFCMFDVIAGDPPPVTTSAATSLSVPIIE